MALWGSSFQKYKPRENARVIPELQLLLLFIFQSVRLPLCCFGWLLLESVYVVLLVQYNAWTFFFVSIHFVVFMMCAIWWLRRTVGKMHHTHGSYVTLAQGFAQGRCPKTKYFLNSWTAKWGKTQYGASVFFLVRIGYPSSLMEMLIWLFFFIFLFIYLKPEQFCGLTDWRIIVNTVAV